MWYRDGTELKPTPKEESDSSSSVVLVDEQKLKLRNVTKSLSGQYVCSASNVEGDGFSKPLRIAIKYRPVCVAPSIEYKNHSEGIDLRYFLIIGMVPLTGFLAGSPPQVPG